MKKGVSLLETVLCCLLLSILGAAVFSLFRFGMRNWTISEHRSSQTEVAQKVLIRLERELNASAGRSLIYDNDALAFASAYPSSQLNLEPPFQLDPLSGDPEWQQYLVFYLQNQALHFREIPIPSGHAARRTPPPLSDYDGAGAPQALAVYCQAGKQLVRGVARLTCKRIGAVGIDIEIETVPPPRSSAQRVHLVKFPRN